MAIAMSWVSRLTSVSVAMVLPGIVGYFIDQNLGTRALFTILGFAAGMSLGIWQLIRFTRQDNQRQDK